MDGAIIIWSSLRLTALRKFNLHDKFVSLSDHTHPYSVQSIFVEQQVIFFIFGGSSVVERKLLKPFHTIDTPYRNVF